MPPAWRASRIRHPTGANVRPVRTGLVLGAGGSVGVAYHGAALAAIEEATGWDPRDADVIVGTSAGSITGSMLRAGVPAADLARISEGQPLSPEGARVAAIGRPHRPRPAARDLLGFRPVADFAGVLHGVTHPTSHPRGALVAAVIPAGGIPTEAVSTGINALFASGWPPAALWICAVDLRSGARVVFGRPGSPPADVGTAVAASSAIPGYFRPVRVGGRRYVDGGVRSFTNLDVVGGTGLDLVIVSAPMSQDSGRPAFGAFGFLRGSLHARLHGEVRSLRGAGVTVSAIEPDRRVAAAMGNNPMDARSRGTVSRVTRSSVLQWLAEEPEGRSLATALKALAGGVGTAKAPAV